MSPPHQILFFIPNLQQGGAERQILELMTRLPSRFAPTLCLYEDVVHYREYLADGEPRHVLGMHTMGPRGLARLVQVLRRERPTILHSFRDKANFWARLAAAIEPVPIVLTGCRNRWMHPIHLTSERALSRVSDRVLVNSEGVRRELTQLARVDPAKIQVIHNFLDIDKFRPPTDDQRRAARLAYGLADDDIALVLPGRISVQKHQLGLMLALHYLERRGLMTDRVKVLLAGRGRDRTVVTVLPHWMALLQVDRYVERLGVVDDMLTLYHAADCLVMPSLYEGLSNAMLEGHACGLPAVVSHAVNVDGILVDGVSGFEHPTFDPRALADRLGRMLALTGEERRRMGAAGRDHVVEKFSADRVLDEFVELYDGLLAEKGLA